MAKGADVNSRDSEERTALYWSVYKKHNLIVKLLLEQPYIDVNYKEASKGMSALNIAAQENVEALQLILATDSVDVNCENSDSWTALCMAASLVNLKAVQVLLADELYSHTSLRQSEAK